VAALARQGDDLTRRVAREAEEGGSAVQKSIQGITRLRQSMTQSAAVMKDMGKRTGEITSIVDTINLIAERTNLLSLNASIEAARAGDAGRGFAVVAEEIRHLADRSAKATADIAAIIRGLQEAVAEAVAASNDGLRVADESNTVAESGAEGLRKILTGVSDIATVVTQVARATEEQRSAAQTVVAAITGTAEQSRLVAAATAEQAKTAGGIVEGTAQMRRIAQEVTKAVGEQGKASRDIIKAAQSTSRSAAQVRRAVDEQANAARQIASAAESMRHGASSTARAIATQVSATEQLSKSAAALNRMAGSVSKAMGEQASAMSQINAAVESMRRQSEQASRAVAEQARGLRDSTAASQNTARQIKLITQANREHSAVASQVLDQLRDVRAIADRNARGVKETHGSTADLVKHAEQLIVIVEGPAPNGTRSHRRRGSTNGRR
jgi:methyl-accepting chemotaxis protein